MSEPQLDVQAWLNQLTAWIDANGLTGYDPFDVKQHPLIRACQLYKWPRRATTALSDAVPVLLRIALGIAKTDNPKAYALVAHGSLRMFQATGDSRHLERAEEMLQWLLDHPSPGYAGLCWGYPFDVFAKGLDTPRNTPIGVVCAIAGEAFALAHALTDKAAYNDAVVSIAGFFLTDIPRMADGGTYCFGYTPKDRRRVHNANLHAVAHLYRATHVSGDLQYQQAAEPALEFSLRGQRADGAWPYGEWDPSEPFERGLMTIVDHHHTGFVLRSLDEIERCAPSQGLAAAIERGYGYYRDNLFLPNGMPVLEHAKYPVDIHACTEAILCPCALAHRFDDALELAGQSLSWTWRHMRNPATGVPYYRYFPIFTSKLLCTRWGVAWLHAALAEYVFQRQSPATD